MKKPELINKLTENSGLTHKQAEVALHKLIEIIISSLQNGQEVTITGFGTFSAKFRSARKGVNPQRPSEKMDIPAVTVPKFKAGKALKDGLKKK